MYRLSWDGAFPLVATVRRIRTDDERTGGDVLFQKPLEDGTLCHIHQTNFNFTSTRSRNELAKYMAGRYGGVDWLDRLEHLVVEVLERERRGNPLETISTLERPEPLKYALWPMLPENALCLLYGMGGGGKGYLALMMVAAMVLPWHQNPFGWRMPDEPRNVLYLDWESPVKDDVQRRMWKLARGMGLPFVEFKYRRCVCRLADEQEEIQEMMLGENIGCVVVDSCGAASGGDINATDTTLSLLRACRRFNCTVLMQSHQAKNVGDEVALPYGNAYYWNYSRAVMQIAKVAEPGAGEVQFGVFSKKANEDRLFKPFGYRLRFGDDRVEVEVEDVADLDEALSDRIDVRQRIVHALRHGPMTTSEVAEVLGKGEKAIGSTLHRLRAAGKVLVVPTTGKGSQRWGLTELVPRMRV